MQAYKHSHYKTCRIKINDKKIEKEKNIGKKVQCRQHGNSLNVQSRRNGSRQNGSRQNGAKSKSFSCKHENTFFCGVSDIEDNNLACNCIKDDQDKQFSLLSN